MDTLATISAQLESQSLNAVVAGFSFASAIAWMDAVRFLLASVVKTPKNGAAYVFLTAILTTLLAVIVYLILSRVSKKVVAPQPPTYAVTGAR